MRRTIRCAISEPARVSDIGALSRQDFRRGFYLPSEQPSEGPNEKPEWNLHADAEDIQCLLYE